VVLLSSACDPSSRADPSPDPLDASARTPDYTETRTVVNLLATDLMAANQITGLSLALIDGQEVVWATGWGHADLAADIPATPRTVYDVGSIAKPITALAVLQAVERGELSLDDPLALLLPQLSLADGAERGITLEDLLTHQSGLPSDWFPDGLSRHPAPWSEIPTEIEGLALATPPRTLTLYSNLGMTLAGAALARASGASYEQTVTQRLLRPAGMRTAHFVDGPEPSPVHLPIHGGPSGLDAIERAAAYREGRARTNPQFRMAPAGGLRASVLDLAGLARLMLGRGVVDGRRLLSAERIDTMLDPHNEDLALDLDQRFGYAWFLGRRELDWAGRVASHGGRTLYHHATLILLPDHDLAVAVASNSLGAGEVIDILAVETLLSALLEKHRLETPSPDSPATPATDVVPPEVDPALLRTFVAAHGGEYATSIGISTVGLHAGALWSRSKVGNNALTLLREDAVRIAPLPDAEIQFLDRPRPEPRILGAPGGPSDPGESPERHIAVPSSEHLMVIARPGHAHRGGVRLPPPEPIPPAWARLVGRWELVLRPGEASTLTAPELSIVDGRLRLEFLGLLEQPPMPVVMALEPLDDHHARIQGLARGQGAVLEIRGQGRDLRLWWLGRELRPMREPSTAAPP